jgi:dTDP-4-dehydrorhamnose 3,5-epimerase
MKFIKTFIDGVFIIELDKKADERGFFARTWCKNEFKENGLNNNLVQCNISFNNKKGTLRGLHFQKKPYEEAKLIRCIQGKIYDVVVDLRSSSKTYGRWIDVELSQQNKKMIYIPEGLAHGFVTLEDNSEVFYQMTQIYYPDSSSGIIYNDLDINIDWNRIYKGDLIVSDKDRELQTFKEFCDKIKN